MDSTKNDLQRSWVESPAEYSSSELLIKGYQVMQDWEIPYMRKLADIATSAGGVVLEVGFGMGLSCSFVQRHATVERHVLIEAHPDVVARARSVFPEATLTGRLELLQGFWEDVVPGLPDGSFDGILFDPTPLDQETYFPDHNFPFFPEAHRLLRSGGVFTYYCPEERGIAGEHLATLERAGDFEVAWEIVAVAPPETCGYWSSDTIVAPIVRKR